MTEIKINKDKNIPSGQDFNRQQFDLKNNRQIKEKNKKPSRVWLVSCIILAVFLIGVLLKWQTSRLSQDDLLRLIPRERTAFGIIDQKKLFLQAEPFGQFLKNNYFYAPLIDRLKFYFEEAGLDYQEVVSSKFENSLGFVLFAQNKESAFPFVFILKTKQPSLDSLEGIKGFLRKDFNQASELYRQVEISNLTSLQKPRAGFPETCAFVQVGDYFLVANSVEVIKQMIDRIIDKS